LVHISQQKFFSFSCTNLTCSASFCTPLKLATHLAQVCVFPPICSWMASKCLVRCSFHENDLLHLSQQKSLIFSCTNFKCFSNPFFLENALVQISQTYCFTFLWKILCSPKLFFLGNESHTYHKHMAFHPNVFSHVQFWKTSCKTSCRKTQMQSFHFVHANHLHDISSYYLF
jgi:hypothetical protein